MQFEADVVDFRDSEPEARDSQRTSCAFCEVLFAQTFEEVGACCWRVLDGELVEGPRVWVVLAGEAEHDVFGLGLLGLLEAFLHVGLHFVDYEVCAQAERAENTGLVL